MLAFEGFYILKFSHFLCTKEENFAFLPFEQGMCFVRRCLVVAFGNQNLDLEPLIDILSKQKWTFKMWF